MTNEQLTKALAIAALDPGTPTPSAATFGMDTDEMYSLLGEATRHLIARVHELEEALGETVSSLGVTFGTMHALYTKPEVCDLLVTLGAPRSAIDAAIGALPHFEAKLAALRELFARGDK